ncbi:MAG: transcriptional repressor [Limnochordaceae bacterium]|nr:transcriptional repressor [Limnochordaceae bacterium]
MHNLGEEAVQRLREFQLRLTPQRQAILEYLLQHPTHPRAEEIYAEVRQHFPSISLGTVYNTLNLLVEKGIVQQITSVDKSTRFDLSRDDHYHLVCERCGRIMDYTHPTLRQALSEVEAESGWKVSPHRLELVGLCPQCQAQSPAEVRPQPGTATRAQPDTSPPEQPGADIRPQPTTDANP